MKILNLNYPIAVQLLKDSPILCNMVIKRKMNLLDSKNDWDWNFIKSYQDQNSLTCFNTFQSSQLLNESSRFDSSILKSLKKLNLNLKDTLNSIKTIEVKLEKNSRGIGMRVYGGIDVNSDDPLDKLIRVKFLFPNQPAFESGLINTGDILTEANGQNMIGISSIVSVEIFFFLYFKTLSNTFFFVHFLGISKHPSFIFKIYYTQNTKEQLY